MDTQNKTVTQETPARRSRLLGSVIAVAAMAGLGGLAWYLTHQPAAAPAGAPGAASMCFTHLWAYATTLVGQR